MIKVQRTVPALCALVVAVTLCSIAQQPPDTREEQLTAMKKLSSMVGTWKGSGWTQMGPERRESTVTETIESRLNGVILVVNGLGKNAEGKTVHQAFGVLSFDPEKKIYKFATYLENGRSTIADATLQDGKLIWGFDTPRGAVRYTITTTETEWSEVGEHSADKQKWQKFFEMKLKKE